MDVINYKNAVIILLNNKHSLKLTCREIFTFRHVSQYGDNQRITACFGYK